MFFKEQSSLEKELDHLAAVRIELSGLIIKRKKKEEWKVIYLQFSHLFKRSHPIVYRGDIIRLNSHSKSMSRSLSVIRETTRSEMAGRTRGHGFTILFEIRHARKPGTRATGAGRGRSREEGPSWFRASVVSSPRQRDKIAVTRAPSEEGFFRGWRYIRG